MSEVEQSVIAALMAMPLRIPEIAEIVQPDSFAQAECRDAFKLMLDVYDEVGALPLSILRERMPAADGVDGVERLAMAVERASVLEDVADYARRIGKAAVRRQLGAKVQAWQKALQDDGQDVDDLLDDIQGMADMLGGSIPKPEPEPDNPTSRLLAQVDDQEAGRNVTLALPWPRLTEESRLLRPGTACLLGGPPGTGKSFFSTSIAIGIQEQDVEWAYLPLEGCRDDFMWRLFAMAEGKYEVDDDESGKAQWRRQVILKHRDVVEPIMRHVAQNPRTGKKDRRGRIVVPPLPHTAVLEWVTSAVSRGCRVVFVDPISQIEFGGRRSWETETEFVRQILGIAADSKATVVLVAHTVKRPGASASVPLSLEDFQGSAMFGRLCQTAILIEAHEWKDSCIRRTGGMFESESHNRTVIVAKSRHGAGSRKRIAFVQDLVAPRFTEVGVVAPKGAGNPF